MHPPDPKITPAERATLNADVKRADATGFREMARCADYEYLCGVAQKAGWITGLSLGKEQERYSTDDPRTFDLGSIRLRPKATSAAKISVAIDGNLALASRIALDQLIAAVGKQ